ncbi:hypothetical protein KR018_001371 [Drosophila ironensis]|nr:hypothetical protein KR018_001371 [Drosophila ironensis]
MAGANMRCINYYDLCRLCTDSADQKTDIYSVEGRTKNLGSKISECLSLKVSAFDAVLPHDALLTSDSLLNKIDEKDRLPKGVCGQCLQTLEQMHVFRATCRNSQTMLSNCLSVQSAASSDKLYIRDAVDESGKSLGVVQVAPANATASAGVQQSSNLLSSIIQAVGMQPQQQYTITVDNGAAHQQQQPQQKSLESPLKRDKQSALEEFIRLKPDIKITPLGKKEASAHSKSQQPPLLSNTTNALPPQPQLQLQPQLGDQLWQQIQQLQLQQQLQQLTSQLNTQFTTSSDDASGLGDSKKPKLNLVLSSPAPPQFTTQLQQFGSGQPQIQLQLMAGGAGALGAPVQPQFNAAALLSTLTAPQLAPNLLSPNKCFLPITIRDENSDQQIVAHIDTKNLVLPTTYQVQMKLQPQLATADGQPIMQLTPTSIPATLQLTPQALGNPSSTVTQNQLVAPQHAQCQAMPSQKMPATESQLPPYTAQVTSQQIIRSPQAQSQSQSSTAGAQCVIRNVTATPPTPTTPSKEAAVFKTPSPRQRQMPAPTPKAKATPTPAPPTAQSAGPPAPDLKRLLTQEKHLQHVKQTSPATAAQTTISSNLALQRLSSNTTITKVAKQQPGAVPTPPPIPPSAPPKFPILNKQNITISRICGQAALKSPAKPAPEISGPHPIPISIPSLRQTQPPPLACQHKKIVRKPPDNSEIVGQKPRAPRVPQQILPLPQQEGQQDTGALSEAGAVTTGSALICPTCNREFKKKEHLTQHVKLHAGLRPFKCSKDGCDKAFSRKEHLNRHHVSHSGQKMYTCEVCRKPFSRKDNLNKHKRIHTHPTNETLYSCDICSKNFSTKLHYEKHREMHKKSHNENETPTASQSQVLSNGQVPSKDVLEIKHRPAEQQQHSQQQQRQAQIMHVVTTQDLAGNTITITQASDSNMNTSLANFVQLGFPAFQNSGSAATNQQLVCKLEK